jgi:hypothetical protein
MPIMAIYRSDTVTPEQYQAYRGQAPIDAVPRGALAHAYSQQARGFVGVDIWETRAALDEYIATVARPASQRVGVAFMEPEVLDLHTFLVTPGADAFVVPFLPM